MLDWLPIVYSESSVGNKVLELFVLGFFYTNSKLASLPSLDADDQPDQHAANNKIFFYMKRYLFYLGIYKDSIESKILRDDWCLSKKGACL